MFESNGLFSAAVVLFAFFLLLWSCKPEDFENPELGIYGSEKQSEHQATQSSSEYFNFLDSVWYHPTDDQKNEIWRHMMDNWSDKLINYTLVKCGFPNWDQAYLHRSHSSGEFLITMPLEKDGQMNGIMVSLRDMAGVVHTYLYHRDEVEQSSSDLLQNHGSNHIISMLITFIIHDQWYSGVVDDELFNKLFVDFHLETLLDEADGRRANKGWCLKRFVLNNFRVTDGGDGAGSGNGSHYVISEDDLDNTNAINDLADLLGIHRRSFLNTIRQLNPEGGRSGGTFVGLTVTRDNRFVTIEYNSDTGEFTIIIAPPVGVIHGTTGEGDREVYYFWIWCADEHDQWDYYMNNYFIVDGSRIDGGGNYTDYNDWQYTGTRWFEGDNERCAFAFMGARYDETFRDLEAELLAQYCGEAAEYLVKKAMDDILGRLCDEYYNGESTGGESYPNGERFTSLVAELEITDFLENHNLMAGDAKICGCNDVNEVIADLGIEGMAVYPFSSAEDIFFEYMEKGNCDCRADATTLRDCVLKGKALTTHEELKVSYTDYNLTDQDFQDFVDEHGYENYEATAVLFEAAQTHGTWDFLDSENLLFYWEVLEQELIPLAITFVPYGIGDAADIYQSCGTSMSWGCAFAVLGILVPLDELADVIRKAPEIKAAWKTVKGYKGLKGAWKVLENSPKNIRTNPEFLEGVRKGLDRGLTSINDVMAAIPNFTAMTSDRMRHILHGDANGGLHHVSGLIEDNSKAVTHYYEKKWTGVYQIIRDSKLSTMFPSGWTESTVAMAIEYVYNKNIGNILTRPNGKKYLSGKFAGVTIEIDIKISDLSVISAYPKYID